GTDAVISDVSGAVVSGTALPPATYSYTAGASQFGITRMATHQESIAGNWTTGDFNGDGRADFAHFWNDSGWRSAPVHSSDGSFGNERWATQQGGWISTGTWLTGDFNGDGKTDFVQFWPGNGWPTNAYFNADAHLSTGTGFGIQRWATNQGRYIEAGHW